MSYIFPYTRRKQKGVVCERETDLETDRQAVGFNDKEAERKRERKRERDRQTDRQIETDRQRQRQTDSQADRDSHFMHTLTKKGHS